MDMLPSTQFPAVIRDILHELVGQGNSPPVVVTGPAATGKVAVGVETVLLASSAGAVVTVINWIDDKAAAAGPAGTHKLMLNLTAAGFSHASELGPVLDAWTGETLTPTIQGADSVVVTLEAVQFANFIVFPRKQSVA